MLQDLLPWRLWSESEIKLWLLYSLVRPQTLSHHTTELREHSDRQEQDLRTQGRTLRVPCFIHCPHTSRQSLIPNGNSQQGKTFCPCWLQEASKSEKCGPVKENPPGNIYSTRHSSQKSLGKLPYSRSQLEVDPLLPVEIAGTMDPLPAFKSELSLFPLASETD